MRAVPRNTSKTSVAGTWNDKPRDGKRLVLLSCPECGLLGDLGDHQIDNEGRVTPSVECPGKGCKFHEMVQLLGWEP